ncbi:MAG: hypothetical protein CMN31_00220 [Sandaracinus sp.]|nr:hypothetical protein [Myxococcales bacterium]MAT26692.1 hypothetical protein [Sandaracinus sp.]MBJ69791.1 hypothetical protein [Sandaracinus sp.]HJL02237.1 hypothetical protein [Polyangiaceae bacterium LLY-WYZ-15_(1-7)]
MLSAAPLWLRSGRALAIRRPRIPFVPRYFVLHLDDPGAPLAPGEAEEMVALAYRLARAEAARVHGDAECFSLLLNGERTRRVAGLHVHVVLARSVEEKRRAFFGLQVKHLTRPLLRHLAPPPPYLPLVLDEGDLPGA